MTSKYKPTDLVRIKELEEVRKSKMYVSRMDKYAGTVQRIDKQFIHADGFYTLEGIPGTYFTDSMIAGLAEEKKTVRVRIDKVHGSAKWYRGTSGGELFVADHDEEWYTFGDNFIAKSDCTIITKEPDLTEQLTADMKESFAKNVEKVYGPEPAAPFKAKEPEEDVPPGIVKLTRDKSYWEWSSLYQPYDEWVNKRLKGGCTIHTIRDSNGVEWSVGEVGKMGYDSFRIDSFRWHPESKAWGVHVTDLDPDDAIQPGEVWLGNISKLPPQQQPEPVDKPVPYEIVKRWMERIEAAIQTGRNIYVAGCIVEEWEDYNGGKTDQPAPAEPDKERLEKYVLAAMAGNEYYKSDELYVNTIMNCAELMMKAVDNYKPVTN